MSTIADAMDYLYDTFNYPDKGEDYDFSPLSENAIHIHESNARHWAEINAVRTEGGCLTWDGLVDQAVTEAKAQVDPNLKSDALLRLAATALTFAASVQRQTDAFNVEPKAKSKAKAQEEE